MNKYEKDIKKEIKKENLLTILPFIASIMLVTYIMFGKPSDVVLSTESELVVIFLLGTLIVGSFIALFAYMIYFSTRPNPNMLQERLLRNFKIDDTYILTIYQPSDGKIHIYSNRKDDYHDCFESRFKSIDVSHSDSKKDIDDNIDHFLKEHEDFIKIKEIEPIFENKGEILSNMLNLKSR